MAVLLLHSLSTRKAGIHHNSRQNGISHFTLFKYLCTYFIDFVLYEFCTRKMGQCILIFWNMHGLNGVDNFLKIAIIKIMVSISTWNTSMWLAIRQLLNVFTTLNTDTLFYMICLTLKWSFENTHFYII